MGEQAMGLRDSDIEPCKHCGCIVLDSEWGLWCTDCGWSEEIC